MSILTFPSLVGSTWDIKKRQFWSTDIETSASGVEFRTAYWTKPIYEFDMQFSYLSQADMVTLQAFYASMQGPFGTFCLNVPNDGPGFSPAVPVLTGDGSTTSVVLPSAVGYVTNVSAMHQTDWQGRQLLYPTARTNLCPYSTNLLGASWVWAIVTGTVADSGVAVAGGPYNYFTVQRSTGSSNQGYLACVLPIFTYAVGDVLRARVWLRAGNSTRVDVAWFFIGAPNWAPLGSFGAKVISGPGTIGGVSSGSLMTILGLSATQDTLIEFTRTITTEVGSYGFRLVFEPGGYPSTTGTSILIGAASASQNQSPGVYIPTASIPVTVTDYTVSNSGTVTLGQAPAAGAVVDADLNYGYLVRFRDDNASTAGAMEINQMMSGFYEQTGLTFRTVR